MLNADPFAQIIGNETVADVIINDAEACALLDSGATADLMTLAYAEARNFDIRLMTELSDCFINLRLAAGFKTTFSGYDEYNLQISGISSYNSDQVALVAEDNTPFSKEVPLTTGTKTEDNILEALKEGEIEMLDSVEMGQKQSIIVQIVRRGYSSGDQEPPRPKFEDHTPYLNQVMEDLLELYKLASATRMEIIPPQSNKTIKARTLLVLMGTSMNVMTEPLHQKLELSGLKSWMEENKEKALNLLAEYHDIFALEDGEMECTEADKQKIKVTDPKPFKERPRNILSGLLEEVEDHLDHMLDVGAIKPSKSAWNNAVVLVRFCINFQD